MKIGTKDWWKGGDASSLGKDALSRPREVGEFYDFYERWSSQIFAFCLLVCGDRGKAEWLTEETFTLYFRGADSVALRNRSRVPVALLRFASDLAKTHCRQRWGAASCGLAQSLLELPFLQPHRRLGGRPGSGHRVNGLNRAVKRPIALLPAARRS